MAKLILVPAFLCVMAATLGAQTKISARQDCAKASMNESAGSGGQLITFTRSECTWTSFTIGGMASHRSVEAGIGEISGSSGRVHGYATNIFDNGDSAIVRYDGTTHSNKDGSGTDKGSWRFVRGTGKLRGISGSGAFKGALNVDGTGWVDVVGRYSLASGKGKNGK